MPAEHRALLDGWEIASSEPAACAGPAEAAALSFRPLAAGPGGGLTAALGGAGPADLDALDWWFRVSLQVPGDGEPLLSLPGLATVCEVWLDGEPVLRSESMYAAHALALPAGRVVALVICCRALAPLLAGRRKPRARWRTGVVSAPNLRFFRTMLLGRAPGFAPGPAVVGPWRGASLSVATGVVAEGVSARPRLDGETGVLAVSGRLRDADGAGALPGSVTIRAGSAEAVGAVDGDGSFAAELRLPGVERWWPHTHGTPALHPVSVTAGAAGVLWESRVGFRSLEAVRPLAEGLELVVNAVPVFCRGAVWTPLSLRDPHGDPAALRAALSGAAAAGINMLRIPGTGCYESAAFWELCDELGMLVWQDLMFANLDYPESDPTFMAVVEDEVRGELARLAARPSLAVVCGGSEVAQQVAMLGLDPALADGPLYGELLPCLHAEARIDAPYVPSAPWGGALPFRTSAGVANYFGVGAYLRPLEDARRAEVRFASECLAFANVPDGDPPAGGVLGAEWKRGVPRDTGAGWDFDDVRDHYLRSVYGIDPVPLRYADPERYLALSRQLTGELMAETFGEWRRAASPCAGGLVLWLRDLEPGAGWGLFDAGGAPKAVLGLLRRALAPLAVWSTDEGLDGIAVHLANDGPAPFAGTLRVALYRDGAVRMEEASVPVALAAHGALSLDAEAVLGRFVDLGWAYRFGPPAGDAFVASLHDEGEILRGQAFRFPAGRPLSPRPAGELGLTAAFAADASSVVVASERLAYGVRVEVPGWRAADDCFCLEPGHPREIALHPAGPADAAEAAEAAPSGSVTALNLAGSVRIAAHA